MRTIEFERTPRETVIFEEDGWAHHPTIKNILLKEKGNTYRLFTNGIWNEVTPEQKSRYIYVAFGGIEIPLHQLKLETFLERPASTEGIKLLGNHIDGNIFNNDIDNLEWVTYRGNIIHAYESGLRSDNKPLVLVDLHSGEEFPFYSLNECARYLKLNPSKITQYLRKKRFYPFQWKYDFKLDGLSPNNLTSKDVGKASQNKPRPFIMRNISTGEERELGLYRSIRRIWGVSERTLQKVLSGKMKIDDVWEFVPITDPDRLIHLSNTLPDIKEAFDTTSNRKNMAAKKSKAIKVTGPDETTFYSSIKDFSQKNGFNAATIQKFIYKNPGKPWNNYVITYV